MARTVICLRSKRSGASPAGHLRVALQPWHSHRATGLTESCIAVAGTRAQAYGSTPCVRHVSAKHPAPMWSRSAHATCTTFETVVAKVCRRQDVLPPPLPRTLRACAGTRAGTGTRLIEGAHATRDSPTRA